MVSKGESVELSSKIMRHLIKKSIYQGCKPVLEYGIGGIGNMSVVKVE